MLFGCSCSTFSKRRRLPGQPVCVGFQAICSSRRGIGVRHRVERLLQVSLDNHKKRSPNLLESMRSSCSSTLLILFIKRAVGFA